MKVADLAGGSLLTRLPTWAAANASKIRSARKLLDHGTPRREVAASLGVSVPTLYRWVPAAGTTVASQQFLRFGAGAVRRCNYKGNGL
ncbi:helix-turn-helix domain-containing protein [Paenarthrobacter ureafaciens]|uniref:helix-turn-helix domain-containing protein n=1 Tax=Paenarthrobacter TaxID=1742992 RepID=UPI00111A9594